MSAWEGLTPPYATIVADPPWHYDARVIEWGHTEAMPYSTMSNDDIARLPVMDIAAADAHLYLWTTNQHLWLARDVALGWGFEPSQVLTWCKQPSGLKPGGKFSPTTEFVVYARREHGGGVRLRKRAGDAIRAAREAAGISRADLHREVRGGEPTGIVARWEDDDSTPNPTDWVALQGVLPLLAHVERPVQALAQERERVNSTWWLWPQTRHSVKPAAFFDIVETVSPGPYVELFARQPRLGWDHWGHGYEMGGAA